MNLKIQIIKINLKNNQSRCQEKFNKKLCLMSLAEF